MGTKLLEPVFLSFVFSISMLYLLSTLLILWFPKKLEDDKVEDHIRMHTAVVANSTLIALSILMLIARACSSLGNGLVGIMHSMLDSPSSSGAWARPLGRMNTEDCSILG